MANTPVTGESRPRYPYNLAFVLQIARESDGVATLAGRVEHIATGRALCFEDRAQLYGFVAEVLGELEAAAAGPPAKKRASPARSD